MYMKELILYMDLEYVVFCKYSINIIACSLFNTTQISYCGLSIFMIIARKTKKTEFKLSESKYAYRVSQD